MKLLTEFVFESFDEAMNIHRKIYEIGRANGFVTCADLYLLLHPDETHCEEIYYKHGWTNLFNSKVEPCTDVVNGKWMLKMPQIKLLNKKENE